MTGGGSPAVPEGRGEPHRAWLLVGALALVAFTVLSASVQSSALVGTTDRAVQSAVLALRSPGLTVFLQAFTDLGTFPVVIGTALTGVVVLAMRTRSWSQPIVLAAGVAFAALVIYLVKIGVARPRPDGADRIGPAALDYSFPSGHTGNGTTAWVLVCLLIGLSVPHTLARRLTVAAAVLIGAVIGLTRVYLGYHWPTDVLGSWLLAVGVIGGAVYAATALRRPVRDARGSQVVGAPVRRPQ